MRTRVTEAEVMIRATAEGLYVRVARAGREETFTFKNDCDDRGLTGADLESVLSACGVVSDYDEVECDCNDRSWYGDDHDSACPVTIARTEMRLNTAQM